MSEPCAAIRAWMRQEAWPWTRIWASGIRTRAASWSQVPAAAIVRAPASASSSRAVIAPWACW